MKKNELINLKRKLEKKVFVEDAYSRSGVVSLFEIEQNINTAGAVENIEKYFESVITYFSTKDIKYDQIILRPLFSIIINEKDLGINGVIKDNFKPIPDMIVVRINGFYCMNNDQRIEEDPDIIYSDNFNDYVVILDDFISLLSEKGFDFNGISTVEELKEKIILGYPTFGDIILSLSAKRTKIKD